MIANLEDKMTKTYNDLVLERPWLAALFLGRLVISQDHARRVLIIQRGKRKQALPFAFLSDFASFQNSTLTLSAGNKSISFGSFFWAKPGAFIKKLNLAIAPDMYERSRPVLDAMTQCLRVYLKDSNIPKFKTDLEAFLNLLKKSAHYIGPYFNEDERHLTSAASRFKGGGADSDAELMRKLHEEHALKKWREFFDKAESYPLTQSQRLSVIRNNDNNLILAAAGTGKTSVMVAKALYLIKTGLAKPQDILILAYNKSAAFELAERIQKRAFALDLRELDDLRISTFHSLGRTIIAQSGGHVLLTKFEEDEGLLKRWIDNFLFAYLSSSIDHLRDFVRLFMSSISYNEMSKKHAQQVETADLQALSLPLPEPDEELRTLNNDLVRSRQEVKIADWLFTHSVPYIYEDRYVSKKRVEPGIDYKPDFHIAGTDIYIEHFGIDRNGHTADGVDEKEYREQMEQKRKIHQEHGTILLETYSYDFTEKNIYRKLNEFMLAHHIPVQKKSADEILQAVRNNKSYGDHINLLMRCLKAIRVNDLDYEKIKERYDEHGITLSERYAAFFNDLLKAYRDELGEQHAIDFDDMILSATGFVKNGTFTSKWNYILIDEFQDISLSRLELIKSLAATNQGTILCCVGDDWQSIYRFSGGVLEATTRFDQYVGPYTLTKLEKTYRYNNSIADTAGTFIQENPEQFKKTIVTHDKDASAKVHLCDYASPVCKEVEKMIEEQIPLKEQKRHTDNLVMTAKALEIIKEIRERDKKGSIAVMGRYNALLKPLLHYIKHGSLPMLTGGLEGYLTSEQCQNIKLWTLHRAKGLEADYCIILGMLGGKYGFPSRIENPVLLDGLFTKLDPYPFSEERRLLYVGITRARHDCYLISSPIRPSDFVDELLTPKYHLDIRSEDFKRKFREIFKCPYCAKGYYELMQGQFGAFYRCTSGVRCQSRPRVCQKCGAPSIDGRNQSVCQNPLCGHAIKICPVCGRPLKLRQGKYGKFWGCTGYGLEDDSCSYTAPYRGP